MVIEEQDEIIDMLEKLRDHKRYVYESIKICFSYIYCKSPDNNYPSFRRAFCRLQKDQLLKI
jgi:hypothetical protein